MHVTEERRKEKGIKKTNIKTRHFRSRQRSLGCPNLLFANPRWRSFEQTKFASYFCAVFIECCDGSSHLLSSLGAQLEVRS